MAKTTFAWLLTFVITLAAAAGAAIFPPRTVPERPAKQQVQLQTKEKKKEHPGRLKKENREQEKDRYADLKRRLEEIIAGKKGTYGIYVMDLKTGAELGIHGKEVFHGASTIKIPLNLYLYRQIAAGKVDPDTMLTYRKEHAEGGSGILNREKPGTMYSIRRLSEYSIVFSDNTAANMLFSYLGYARVKDFMRSLGGTVIHPTQNTTCPRDMALYMAKTVEFAQNNPEIGNRLVRSLENTIYNDRIPEPLPDGTQVAHKIGNWSPAGTYNDVGWVKHPERPYIIAVLTKDVPGAAKANKVIQDISAAVYRYQEALQTR